MKTNLYVGLVHYPTQNKDGKIVTTSLTNLDIHDIARTCKTFGVKEYFIIHPLPSQKELLDRILEFWHKEIAKTYNPHRVSALQLITYAASIEFAINKIKNQETTYPLILTTTAKKREKQLSFRKVKSISAPVFVLFGTGNGLAESVHESADFILQPIMGLQEYNHLSVRSAVAIILDRIVSEK
jgi:tRNA (guanine37-N1)-methyltransferase